jgi:hypothetical protein
VVIGLIALIATSRRRHRAGQADWQTRLIDAYAKGAALHDAMAAAEAPGALAAPDATARWSDIQRRADDFGQMIYALQEAAPDDQTRVRISEVLASLQAVRSAMATERTTPDDTGTMPGVVRDRLSFFMASLQQLRDPRIHPA